MLIGKMFGLSSATGLALDYQGDCGSFFWAAVGTICFILLTRSRKHRGFQDPREQQPQRSRHLPEREREFPKQPFTAKRNRVRHFPRRRRGHKQPIQRSTLSSRHAANPAPNDTRSAKGRSLDAS